MFPSGQKLLSSLSTLFQFNIATDGPENIALMASGGTFVADGTNAVVVPDTNVTAESGILIMLKTVGGTVGAIPSVKTKTAGVGFTVSGTASDTSTYTYIVLA